MFDKNNKEPFQIIEYSDSDELTDEDEMLEGRRRITRIKTEKHENSEKNNESPKLEEDNKAKETYDSKHFVGENDQKNDEEIPFYNKVYNRKTSGNYGNKNFNSNNRKKNHINDNLWMRDKFNYSDQNYKSYYNKNHNRRTNPIESDNDTFIRRNRKHSVSRVQECSRNKDYRQKFTIQTHILNPKNIDKDKPLNVTEQDDETVNQLAKGLESLKVTKSHEVKIVITDLFSQKVNQGEIRPIKSEESYRPKKEYHQNKDYIPRQLTSRIENRLEKQSVSPVDHNKNRSFIPNQQNHFRPRQYDNRSNYTRPRHYDNQSSIIRQKNFENRSNYIRPNHIRSFNVRTPRPSFSYPSNVQYYPVYDYFYHSHPLLPYNIQNQESLQYQNTEFYPQDPQFNGFGYGYYQNDYYANVDPMGNYYYFPNPPQQQWPPQTEPK